MNTTAVSFGLLYGLITAVVCYVVSMITSGLFARPFYRLYARILIGICSLMLVAPALRWLGGVNPEAAAMTLTLAQYAVMAVLGYGVFRFNRDYLNKVFLDRSTTAYFVFGTLANAAVVTLAFLHFAITGSPQWQQHGVGYVGVAHYGPLLVVLAAMIFHSDFHLKQSVGDLRRFSRFTFVGYAVSFVGLAFSIVPYLGDSISQWGVAAADSPWLQNFFSAQALLLAISVYAWLVWRYESIPPLFLLLLAVIAEYHILVTQWVIKAFGPASWGLASLPLFVLFLLLDHYFAGWDERKRKRLAAADQAQAGVTERFATPFRVVLTGLGSALLGITLSTRFTPQAGDFYPWLTATFAIYACVLAGMAVQRKEPALVYLGGLLAGLAGLLGPASAGGPMSAAILGMLATFWGVLAVFGDRINLKQPWRTPLADCSLISASLTTIVVFGRHLVGPQPYYFDAVGALDAVGLALAAVSFLICAHQYRSALPVFAAVIGVATAIPPWCATIGLGATMAAALIQRRAKTENPIALQDRLKLFGVIKLPLEGLSPELYVQPLSIGAIPMALIGLLISVAHVLQGNFTTTVLIGAATSAIVLLWLSRRYRSSWLYITALLASYFAVHCNAHGWLLQNWPEAAAVSAHLFIAAAISLFGWAVATVYTKWCGALLRRVAEEKEEDIRAKRAFYAGLLYQVTWGVALTVLAGVGLMWLGNAGDPIILCATAAMLAVLFAHSASLYATQLVSYLSLSAMTLAILYVLVALGFSRPEMALVIGAIGLTAAVISCLGWARQPKQSSLASEEPLPSPLPRSLLPARGIGLWLSPLAVYSLVCGFVTVIVGLMVDVDGEIVFGVTWQACVTLAMAAGSYLLATRAFRTTAIYLAGIALSFAAIHASVSLALGQQSLDLTARMVHMAVMSGLALASCFAAAVLAFALNRRLDHRDPEGQALLLENRSLYAGTLLDFALGASVLVLFALGRVVALEAVMTPALAPIIGVTCALLAATFSFSGLIYHSRIQTYLALAAASLGLHTAATMLVPEAQRIAYQTFSVSASALMFGVLAWWIGSYQRNTDSRTDRGRWKGIACREQLPLPLVSMDAMLWARPLGHVSVFLAYLAVFLVGRDWVSGKHVDADTWLIVTPVYLAALALLVATVTHPFGWLRPFFTADKGNESKRAQTAIDVEKGLHYLTSLITGGLAVHLTVQLTALHTYADRFVVSCHLLLAALLALVGWTLATVGIYRYGRRLRSLPDRQQGLRKLVIYGGLLQRFTVVVALAVTAAACAFGVPPEYRSIPLAAAIGLVTLLFAGISVTYRSRIASYASLLVLGLCSMHLAALGESVWGTAVALDAPAISVLALALVATASIASVRTGTLAMKQESAGPLPWLRPRGWKTDSVLSTWIKPLCEASVFYAAAGWALMVVHRWFLQDSWTAANVQALITYGCVAITFTVAARIYDTALLTYAAAIVVTFSAVPQLLIAGVPITHLGIALSVIALLFWIAGFIVERYCIRLSRAGTSSKGAGTSSEGLTAKLTRVYERPMIRCSAILALIAIAHSLFVWIAEGWSVSQTSLVIACALGAVTLLLNARSLNVLSRFALARIMVYLGCASMTGCVLAAAAVAGSFQGLGPVAAVTGLILAAVGLRLLESSRVGTDSQSADSQSADSQSADSQSADFQRTYGEPITNFAAGLSIVAVVVSLATMLVSLGGSWVLLERPFAIAELDVPLVPAAVTLLVSAAICTVSTRTQKQIAWLYTAVGFVTAGLYLLLESLTDWTRGEMILASLVLMNLLVVLARVIRVHRQSVAKALGLAEPSCDRPFFVWPLFVTTVLLVIHSVCVGYLLTGLMPGEMLSAALQWPWLWVSLLTGGLFLHMLWLQTDAAYVHLLVWSTVVGVVGACISTDLTLTSGDGVAAVGFGWGALAIGLLAVDRISRRRGTKPTDERLFSGAGNSIMTIVYLVISALAIAPAVMSTPAPSVALSMALISLGWLWMTWVSGEEVLGYAAVIGFFAASLFAAHALLEIPIVGNPMVAFFVIGYSFLLYGANILLSRSPESKSNVLIRPTYYLALLLPVTLIVATPFDQKTPAAFALLAAAAFYLLVAQQSKYRWALYVAAGLANYAIYLWVPTARELTGLYQLYVIPAAITVLVFAQLHHRELNHNVLSSIRLAASGAILAVSTYEVFFTEESGLLQFVAILLLSLAGITAGIALRVRAFIYVGLAFLVINVVGQLGLQFHHEGGIIRAIILIGAGLLILSAMIFFNIHRERILRQYRGFVADKSWE